MLCICSFFNFIWINKEMSASALYVSLKKKSLYAWIWGIFVLVFRLGFSWHSFSFPSFPQQIQKGTKCDAIVTFNYKISKMSPLDGLAIYPVLRLELPGIMSFKQCVVNLYCDIELLDSFVWFGPITCWLTGHPNLWSSIDPNPTLLFTRLQDYVLRTPSMSFCMLALVKSIAHGMTRLDRAVKWPKDSIHLTNNEQVGDGIELKIVL